MKKIEMLAMTGILLTVLVCVSGCSKDVEKTSDTKRQLERNVFSAQFGEEKIIEKPINKTQGSMKGHNDANSGADVSGDLLAPYVIDYGEYKGIIAPEPDKYGRSGDKDAYGLKWNSGDTIDILIIPNKELDISFSGSKISSRNDGLKGESESIKMTTDVTSKTKNISFIIFAIAGGGDYTLKITKTPQNDGDKGQDAPQDWEQPLPISAGKYESCYLGSRDRNDDYAIKLKAGEKIIVRAIPSDELDVRFGRWQGKDAVHGSWSADEINYNFKGESEKLEVTVRNAGIYKFGVGNIGKTRGAYTLDVSVE